MLKSILLPIIACILGQVDYDKNLVIRDNNKFYLPDYFSYIYNNNYEMLIDVFLEYNMQYEGKSKDTVDIYNFYNGEFYGTNYGLTYYAFMEFTKTQMSSSDFIKMGYNQTKYIFLKHIKDIPIKYIYNNDLIYLYVFYVFRFTKYAYLQDYNYCKDCEDLVLCIKRRFEKRLKILIMQNPYYALGYINRYYIYYNMSSKYVSYKMIPELY